MLDYMLVAIFSHVTGSYDSQPVTDVRDLLYLRS